MTIKPWHEQVTKDAKPLFEKLTDMMKQSIDHLRWLEALRLFVSRKNPEQVIAALEACDESFVPLKRPDVAA